MLVSKRKNKLAKAIRLALVCGAISTISFSAGTMAAEADEETADDSQTIQITGSRIRRPGVVSASPILSISSEELSFQLEPEIESILRNLPSTIPGDGSNVNNGSAGAATIDLRGLGPERNLILMDGRRMVPFNFDGEVDSATIPTALVERIDVVTGGASAVYGSDAIAGAINFVLKNNFEGVEIDTKRSQTGDSDGKTNSISLTLGASLAEGRGNAAISLSWLDRKGVLLGARPLGLLGIDTADGSNYQEFLNGQPPVPPISGCGGPFVVESGGSTTAIPTRFAIVGGGAGTSGQFREDRTLGADCSRFNFSPFNYYQTPLERYSATAIAHYDVNESVTAYTNFNFTNATVDAQVAPSGTFGATFQLPLANPFIGAQALQFMLDAGNTALANGTLNPAGGITNWFDLNNNGTVDSQDRLLVQLRRRTLELGPRTEAFETNQFQFVAGARGDLGDNWEYDVSFSYGESNRVTTRDGYTNLTNIQNALDSTDGVTCANGDITCVPIDLFGGFGTITEEMAGYARAIALQTQSYEQTIGNISFDGSVDAIQFPTAGDSLALGFGFETREEKGALEPDECLKLAPSSCQGGAGGNLLPISGGYKVDEFFLEGFLPILEDQPFADTLDFEFGYRSSDYSTVGSNDTWKVGLNWRPVEEVLFRVMQQQATRAPNVGELSSPVTTGLDNAQFDPCSSFGIADGRVISPELEALCISTGMVAAQVGSVQDVISGQVNVFEGSDPNALPGVEEADTFTAGIVWTPSFDAIDDLIISVDYYDIDIKDVIGEFSAQEVLDSCYVFADASACSKIKRIGGDLTISGSGIEQFTTNLDFLRAEGLEISWGFKVELEDMGRLEFSGVINKYLTQESLSSSQFDVLDCKGFYGTSCDPLSELRWTQRTTWKKDDFSVSAQWRHIDSVDIENAQLNSAAGVFPEFQTIDAFDYIDLFANYTYQDITFSLGIDNVFEEEPPVVGNEAGDTSSNSGNTFPSNYDTLGRIFKFGVNFRF